MTTNRPGALHTALAAVSDTVQGFRDVPRPYVIVLVVMALTEFIVLPYSLDPQADVSPLASFLVLGFMLISTFLLISPYIGLVRYFLYGDISAGFEPRGPILRVFGWMLALGFASMFIFSLAAVIAFLVGGASHAIIGTLTALTFIAMFWAYLRLSTVLVGLALDGPVSISARFAETKGHVWFILRTFLASLVVLVPYMLIMVAIQFGVFGAESFEADIVPTPTLGQRLLDALLTGILGAAYFAYLSALYVRIFRAIPGR